MVQYDGDKKGRRAAFSARLRNKSVAKRYTAWDAAAIFVNRRWGCSNRFAYGSESRIQSNSEARRLSERRCYANGVSTPFGSDCIPHLYTGSQEIGLFGFVKVL